MVDPRMTPAVPAPPPRLLTRPARARGAGAARAATTQPDVPAESARLRTRPHRATLNKIKRDPHMTEPAPPPTCPNCMQPMALVRTLPGGGGLPERQSWQCQVCKSVVTRPASYDDMR